MTRSNDIVGSFDELLRPFSEGVNALCFSRTLEGDFDALAAMFANRADDEGGLLALDAELLRQARGADSRVVAVLLEDLRRLEALGRNPQLNVLTRYPRDARGLPVSVDVHSFHVDRAPVEADTFLCTYAGAPSEGLRAGDAERLVDDPSIRRRLREHYGRDEGFDAWLVEECFDLHYHAKPGATPFSFGNGHLWRLAVAWPDARVAPCVHRAPLPDGRPRLMLIS